MRKFIWIAGFVGLLTLVGWSRSATFWIAHDHPVELAYTALSMKMGTSLSLDSYHCEGVVLHPRIVAVPNGEGLIVTVVTPRVASTSSEPSFDVWPKDDTNPFKFKPPMLPAFLAYAHHQFLGFKTTAYPLILDLSAVSISDPLIRRFVWDAQAWAVMVPFVSGVAVIMLVLVLGWRMGGLAVGLTAAALTALHPYQILTSSRIWPEAVMTAFLLLATLLIHFFVGIRSWAGCFAAGIALAMAALTDPMALFAIPALWVWTMVADTSVQSIIRRVFNPYILMAMLGLAMIAQVWPKYIWYVLQEPFWARSVFDASQSGFPMETFVKSTAALFVLSPALIATFWPLARTFLMLFIAVSVIAVRWIYHPAAPWDERAIAPIIPFLAICASAVICGVIRSVRDRIWRCT